MNRCDALFALFALNVGGELTVEQPMAVSSRPTWPLSPPPREAMRYLLQPRVSLSNLSSAAALADIDWRLASRTSVSK